MIKRVAFVRRAADVAAGEFGPRWCDEARAMIGAMPAAARPRRLAHCVVRHGRQPAEHDGIAIAWHDDESITTHDTWLAEHLPTPAASATDASATTVVRVEERTVYGGPWLDERWRRHAGASQLLLIGLIAAAAGTSRTAFADYWWSHHRPLANQLVPSTLEPVAYVHDYLLPGEPTPWAGIGEMYETSLDVARRRGAWFDSRAASALVADEERFLDRATRQLMITDQHIIVADGRVT